MKAALLGVFKPRSKSKHKVKVENVASEESLSNPSVLSASNDELSSINGSIKSQMLSKMNSTGTLSSVGAEQLTAHMVKCCSTTTSLTATTTSDMSGKKVHSSSTQELQQENRTFSRSVSVSSTNTTDSTIKLKTQRAFSVDDALAEESCANIRNQSFKLEHKSNTLTSKTKPPKNGFQADKTLKHKEQSLHLEKKTESSSSIKMCGDTFSSENLASLKKEQRLCIAKSQETIQKENIASKLTYSSKTSINSQNLSQEPLSPSNTCNSCFVLPVDDATGDDDDDNDEKITEDFELLKMPNSYKEKDNASYRITKRMESFCRDLKAAIDDKDKVYILKNMNKLIREAWAVPTLGHELGFTLCSVLRDNFCIDILLAYCEAKSEKVRLATAQVFEQCLSTENRNYVVKKGLHKLVSLACSFGKMNSLSHVRLGTGILEHLFKHSEETCSELLRMESLNVLLYNCRVCDVETLRHCAAALANLSLYGGHENHKKMIEKKAPEWLFPLAFQNDDNIKYYACLAISVLVANKEIEAAVLHSGTLCLVEPFVTSHDPEDFSRSTVAHFHGQSKDWLSRLVPVLESQREEARNLAAFHFVMEAGIKKKQGNTAIFREIGAVDALKKVASSPNAIASKFAAQALHLIGETIPHKLSQQVPLWSVEDVGEWIKQIEFSQFITEFTQSRVDGDLLLQLTEEMLRDDIGIKNGILRKRFLRELDLLKCMADYTSCDPTNLNGLLQSISPEFSKYTYQMIHAGVQRGNLQFLMPDQLAAECGIFNSIHQLRISKAVQGLKDQEAPPDCNDATAKNLDVFISYRRSNGSQLASLLKVHLQLKGFSVFIDVERLEAGKFDNNLLKSIKRARNFLLVLTPDALERCVGDVHCKDWVHKEIVAALESKCNIIPVTDNFNWPKCESLPEDMRAITRFNAISWIHDYQDACVEKLERFLKGEPGSGTKSQESRGPSTPASPRAGLPPRAPPHDIGGFHHG